MKTDDSKAITASDLAIAAGPLIALSRQAAVAADAPRVALDDPQAVALAYVPTTGDASVRCAHCQFFTGIASADQGPCALFPGKQVATAGHCNAWVG